MIAKAALARTKEAMAAKFRESLDPRCWAQRHPLPTMGVAAVTGFAIAVRLSAPPVPEAQKASSPLSQSTQGVSKKSSALDSAGSLLFSMVFTAGVDLLKEFASPLVQNLFHPRPLESPTSSQNQSALQKNPTGSPSGI